MVLIVIEIGVIALLFAILCAVIARERRVARDHTPHARIDAYWHGQDRRACKRFAKTLDATYTIEAKPHMHLHARTIDISEGGLRLVVDSKFHEGAILDLSIPLPEINAKIEVEGKVSWTHDAEGYGDPAGKRLFFAGIHFCGISGPHAKILAEYIRRISAQS